MARPEAVRRIKSYSAATGYVYQYFFHEVQKARRGSATGNAYIYMVSVDRKTMFPLSVLVRRDALDQWSQAHGRALTGTEEYAVAKMRLFAAFDEIEDLAASRPEFEVDGSNLDALLAALDL